MHECPFQPQTLLEPKDTFLQEWQLEACSEDTFLGSCGKPITDYNGLLIKSTMNYGKTHENQTTFTLTL